MNIKNHIPRLLCILLCCVMLLGLLPTAALAESEADERIRIARIEARMTKEAVPKYGASTEIRPTLTLKRALTEDGTEVTDIPDGGVELLSETGGYFAWQVWDAELEGWTYYHEKTFAMGKYRALCTVRLLNVGSDKFAERYKFDSPGLSAIVYDNAGSPMTWETRTIVHEKTYSSAVLLSPIYTVSSSTAEPLEGRIFFTSAMRTGEAVSVAVSDCNAPAGNLRYRWQRLNEENGAWYDWSGVSTSGSISAHDMGYATGTMRLVVTAEGYSGQLVSEERTVIPAAMPEEPVAPKLRFLPLDNDPYGRGVIQVTNPAGSWQLQDYLLSENPMTQEQLDAAPTEEESKEFYGRWVNYFHVNGKEINYFLARPDRHYYVYTRVTGIRAFLPGRTYTYTTIYTGNTEEQIYLTELNLGDYGASGTIYVPVGEKLKLALKKQAPDANTWNYIRLKAYESNPSLTEAVPFSMIIDDSEYSNEFLVGAGAVPYGITIKAGDTAGTGYLGAFYSSASGDYNLNYGLWKVVVYDPANITDYEIVNAPVLNDVTMNVGDTYTPSVSIDAANLTRPAGALENCTFEWYARVGTAPIANEPLFVVDDPAYQNEFISVDKTTGKVTALKPHGEGNDEYKQVALFAVKDGVRKKIATYQVTVNPSSADPILLVTPGTLTMSVGEILPLTAQLIRGESITDSFIWSSADTAIAAVNGNGGKAEVTAAAPGDTTILVKIADLAAQVNVHVHQWSGWTPADGQHYHECLNCGEKEYEDHTPDRDAATAEDPVKCEKCGVTLVERIGVVKVELPFAVTVKQGGNVAPGKQEFELEVFDTGVGDIDGGTDLTVTARVQTNGAGDYNAKLVIEGPEDLVEQFVCEGFFVREKNTKAVNWTYSDAVWRVMPEYHEDEMVFVFYPAERKTSDNGEYYEFDTEHPAGTMTFVNTYTENKSAEPTEPTKPEAPKTGDGSNLALWLSLLIVSAGAAALIVFAGKRKATK